jgi:hypothetical protein
VPENRHRLRFAQEFVNRHVQSFFAGNIIKTGWRLEGKFAKYTT